MNKQRIQIKQGNKVLIIDERKNMLQSKLLKTNLTQGQTKRKIQSPFFKEIFSYRLIWRNGTVFMTS